jgi:proteasome lid subunit RPN8/RPN11
MILEPHFEEIVEHFNAEYPREGCGVIGIIKGKSRWFPCKNVAEDIYYFKIDSKDYIKASHKADIVAVVHSHPDASPKPSETDVKQCNGLNLDYYIISIPEIQLEHLKPNRVDQPLIGREYEFGVNDCFSLVQSYYEKFDIKMHRYPFEDYWWDKGLDYFGDLWKEYEGWSEVTDGSILKHDLLFFNMQSSVPNHCGIYLENDLFLHHAHGRMSSRELLYSFWGKFKTKILRNEKCKQYI